MDNDKKPCHQRVIDDTGGAFAVGFSGSCIFQITKMFTNSSIAFKERMARSIAAVKTGAPLTGGRFTVWAGVFSACDCSLAHIRNKDDPYNSIIGGSLTGAILASRKGVPVMLGSGVAGGLLLSVFEASNILSTYIYRPNPEFPPLEKMESGKKEESERPATTPKIINEAQPKKAVMEE